MGNVVATTDPLQNTTYYGFDSLNRITATKDPLARVNSYTYDTVSNLLSSQDPNLETTYFTYDNLNRQTKILYPDATFSYYNYDAVSNLTAMNSENGWTYFTFDALNRPIEEKQPDGTIMSCVYDAIGRKTSVESAWLVYYSYDDANRMTEVKTIDEEVFDGWGDQTWGTSPYGGSSVFTTPATYEYNAVNNVTRKVLSNGNFCYYEYDAANRLTKLRHSLSTGAPLVYFDYTYDSASRITNVARENGNQIYLEYDADSRLTNERWLNSSNQELYAFVWDYDLAGNRIYQNNNGVETYFTYNSDNALVKKVAIGQFSYYTYDERGNCVLIEENDGSTYFEYNHANLVTSIKYKSGVTNAFYYDSLLRRYALQDSDGLRYFTWDSSGTKLLDERDINGNVTAYYTHGYSYVNGIGTMVTAKKNENSAAYYQFPAMDQRGSVYRLTNENNEITATYEYNAFGEPLQNQETGATNRMGYSTNWLTLKDSNHEIILSPSRLYSTSTGQFLQKDFLFPMTLLKQQGKYRTSIFRSRRRNIFSVDNYGLYRAFKANPVSQKDRLGLDEENIGESEKREVLKTKIRTKKGDPEVICDGSGANFSWRIKFELEQSAPESGYIYQLINRKISESGTEVERESYSFFEILAKIEKNKKTSLYHSEIDNEIIENADDNYNWSVHCPTKGTLSVDGLALFATGEIPEEFSPSKFNPIGTPPMMSAEYGNEPNFWNEDVAIVHSLFIEWDFSKSPGILKWKATVGKTTRSGEKICTW